MCDSLRAYVALLQKWNRVHNLVSARDLDSIYSRHIMDSLAAAPHLQSCSRLADIGSGAGLPGLVLAVALPAQQWTLVEARTKKCAFLEQARLDLGLRNIIPVCSRVESYNPLQLFDGLVCRAFAEPCKALDLCGHLLPPGAALYVMAARQNPEQLPPSYRLADSLELSVPGYRRYLWRIVKAP